MSNFKEIGFVKSNFKEPADPFKMREYESIIEIKKEFEDGLYRIEESEYIEIIFSFHLSKDYELKTTNYYGEYKGVFATRSPRRPSGIGVSKVKLIKREKNILYLKGLDAIDGTPVLDIKPYNNGHLNDENESLRLNELKNNPRKKIIQLARNNKREELLILSAAIHGHFCPGLSIGVIAAIYVANKIRENADGMEDILAVIEINSCFTDAIQYITGCTVGNNSLIYKDLGKTAFSLVKRDGKGIRLSVKPSYRDLQIKKYPEFQKYFDLVVVQQKREEEVLDKFKKYAKEASFQLLTWNIEDIFRIENVSVKLPNYAPIKDTVYCSTCGEGIMKSKEIFENDKAYCKTCKNINYFQLDGSGINVS